MLISIINRNLRKIYSYKDKKYYDFFKEHFSLVDATKDNAQ